MSHAFIVYIYFVCKVRKNSVNFHLADIKPVFPWLENSLARAIYGLVQTLDFLRVNPLEQATTITP